ncbi:MAG TPA: YdeI/OmpD-associated family protein [Verrucomicrobiaceae bacterium]
MDCRPSRTKDPDHWIATCPPFSKPICEALRELIFRWEPDLKESIKTNMLTFAGCRSVCALGGYVKGAEVLFFRGAELHDAKKFFNSGLENVSIRDLKLTSLEQLDRATFRALLHEAVKLDRAPSLPRPPRQKREPLPMPSHLATALKGNRAASAFFDSLKPTYQREYIAWNTFVKTPEARARRLAETMAALSAGRKWAQRKLA